MRLQKVRRTLLFFSFLAFPVTFIYLSPALALAGAYEGVVTGGLLAWSLVLVSSLFVGRAFCSYLCPLGGLQRSLDAGLGRPLVRVRCLRALKYLIWAPWVGLIIFFAVRGGGFRAIAPAHLVEGYPLYGPQSAVAFGIFAGLAAVSALFLGRRAFCHYLCFFSPLNIIGSGLANLLRLPSLRVQVAQPGKCVHCHTCTRNCPMSLDVEAMVAQGRIRDRECIACGTCIAGCKAGVLRYTLGLR